MKLSELLADNKTVLCDGAFATFYSKLTGNSERRCELENINNPEIVKRIHTQYINAGAKIIRTNTFSANTAILNISQDELIKVIKQGYMLARECAGENAVVCADISAIYTNDDHDKNPDAEPTRVVRLTDPNCSSVFSALGSCLSGMPFLNVVRIHLYLKLFQV